MKRWSFAVPTLAVALIVSTLVQAQETIKDRKAYLPNRKQATVPGKAVGILLTDGQPVLSTEGRSGPADQLVFSVGGNSYRWVYVPTQDQAMITNLQVPVGDKGEIAIYAALNMANPKSVLPWAIKQSYALVEVEVNGGRGSPAGDSFVATNIRLVEGSKDFPLKMEDVVKQVKAKYAEYLSKQEKAIDQAMKDAAKKALKDKAPTGPREKSELMYLTWLPDSNTVRVHFKTKISDGAYTITKIGGGGPQPLPLPPGMLRPVRPKDFAIKTGTTFGIEFGQAYVVNKKGEIVSTQELPIESFSQQLNGGPIGPRGGPLPVPPAPVKEPEL